jgi:hypothetical protein
VTRVPPQRLPTARPAAAPARAAQPKKPKGAADKKAEAEKPQKLKAGGPAEDGGGETAQASEQGGGGGPGAGKEREGHDVAKQEAMWAPDSHVEASEKKEAKESAHAEKERKEDNTSGLKPGAPQPKEGAKPKGTGPNAAKRQSDGFERTKDAGKAPLGQTTGTQPAMTAQAAQSVQGKQPVNAVHSTRPALAPPPSNRPPDAFQLLHQAQDKGVYFKEDQLGGGVEREDPELAAAVEEAIRLLFGVRGILRVGPGKNMEDAPVVVVVATQGFGEAALKLVPPTVHRFPTVLAIPFDLLPLKKER